MKTKLLLILFSFLLVQVITAQQKDSISVEVLDFWKIVNDNSLYFEKKSDHKKEYSKQDIDNISLMLFKAVNNDPVGFNKYISLNAKKYKEERRSTGNKNLLPPSVKLGNLLRNVTAVYGENFTKTIQTPFYFKGKIITIIDTIYYADDIKRNFGCKKITMLIEDVLKGNKTLKKGSIIDLVYLPMWLESPSVKKEINRSYFVGAGLLDDVKQYVIQMTSREELELFPLINDIVEIPSDYWNLGKKIEWNKFKSGFNEKYILEKK